MFCNTIFIFMLVLIVNGNQDEYTKKNDVCNNHEMMFPLVDIPNLGYVRGGITYTARSKKTIFKFLSIPYGEAPSKNLRFKPPAPKSPWNIVREASEYGRSCPDSIAMYRFARGEFLGDPEDCLTLSVFTKRLTKKVPVMVYVHGGGFYTSIASTHESNYLLEKDVVLVVVQYRVGLFGYLSTQSADIPGNAAAHDVILALKWVQKYIRFFGGDNTQVTLFGQSAGTAISNLLPISPMVPPNLFHRVILQSGSIFSPWAIQQDPLKLASNYCRKLGCIDCQTKRAINQCLMEASVENIVKNTQVVPCISLTLNDYYGLLPVAPQELMQNKSRLMYPIMGGVTKHEGTFVLSFIHDRLTKEMRSIVTMPPKVYIDFLLQKCNEIGFSVDNSQNGLISNLLMKLTIPSNMMKETRYEKFIPSYIDLASIVVFKSAMLYTIYMNSINNKYQNYLYTFDYQGQFTRFGYEEGNDHFPFHGGAHHSDDNIYLFPYPEKARSLNANDTKMSEIMVELWTSFSRDGKPSIKNGPIIPHVSTSSGPYFRIKENITIGVDFLDEFLAATNDPKKEDLIRDQLKKSLFF